MGMPDDNESQLKSLLKRCLSSAATVDQAIKVFNASAMSEGYLEGIPSLALGRMIELAKNADEAKRVYAFASIKRRSTKQHMYPAREKAAKAKLQSLEPA